MAALTEPSKTIKAVERTVQILETLQELEGAGVTEVAEAIGTSKATAHNHLRTLENEELVVKDEESQYDVGLRVLNMAHYAKSRFPISDIVEDEVDKLAEESGEMALFTIEEHWKCVALYIALGEKAVQAPVYIGNREELYNTAIGKAILAHKPPEEIDQYLNEYGLKEVTENTITNQEELLKELEEVRKQGIAYNREEAIHGLVGIGVPIRCHEGTVVGALSIIGPGSRMDEDRLQGEYVDMIKRSANIIEINSTSL